MRAVFLKTIFFVLASALFIILLTTEYLFIFIFIYPHIPGIRRGEDGVGMMGGVVVVGFTVFACRRFYRWLSRLAGLSDGRQRDGEETGRES
jgi:hypothetical protein